MDEAEFERLAARARNPRLIPAIYNYCDGRCRRCPFTNRCLVFLDNQELKAAEGGDRSLADTVGDSLQRTMEMLAEVARREGVRFDAGTDAVPAADAEAEDQAPDFDTHRQDRLARSAREYGHLAWRIGRAVAPIAEARGDAAVVDAVETIEWFSSMISAKLYRAICGQAEGWESPDDAQSDFNGSAKIALVGIDQSRRAWAVLMGAGRATADGVPARAVAMLEALEASVRARFPQAMEFVRPGFDQPDVAAAGEARRAPLDPAPRADGR